MKNNREFITDTNTVRNRKITAAVGRNFRFWGRATLESIGIMLVVAAGLFLLYSLGKGDFSGGQTIRDWITVFPYYLYLGGGFSILMLAIGYFQVYFSLLVSMNNKRTAVAAGILISTFLLIIFVNTGAWLFWKLIGTETAKTAMKLVPVFTGIFFLTGAFSIVLGVIITRWGKIGTIILTAVCMITGGLLGAGIIAIDGIFELIQGMTERSLWTAAAAGLGFYILADIFVILSVRKIEIRS